MFSEYVLLQKLYAKKTNAKVDSHRFPTEKPIAQVVLFETFLTKNWNVKPVRKKSLVKLEI